MEVFIYRLVIFERFLADNKLEPLYYIEKLAIRYSRAF